MQLFEGPAANNLIQDPLFINGWVRLLDQCPWGTVFQSPEFVKTWYDTFVDYSRIILVEFDQNNPIGILFMTIDKNGKLVGVGTNISEYQVWICLASDNQFQIEAFNLLTKKYPKKTISLKYIPKPQEYPIKKLNIGLNHSMLTMLHQRPVMKNNTEWLNIELKKKNRKEKLNRLKKIGELKFESIKEIKIFQKILPELVFQNDLRKGALYGKIAFMDEPKRIDFLLKLFQTGILHVTILKVGETIIASNAGIKDKNIVYLQGLNSFSPYYAKYSPGILHFLMLGKQLDSEMIPFFDLTPGGIEGYKSMLATEFWTCSEILVATKRKILWVQFKEKVKKYLSKYDFTKPNSIVSSKIHEVIGKLNPFDFKFSANFLILKMETISTSKKTIQLIVGKPKVSSIANLEFNRGDLRSLFAIPTYNEEQKRKAFFQDCLKRMETGQEFYSIEDGTICIGVLWSWSTPSTQIDFNNQSINYQFSFLKKNWVANMEEMASIVHSKWNSQSAKAQLIHN